jgi:hypothetical protein
MNLWILPESISSSLLPFNVGLVLSLIFLINFLSITAVVEVMSPPIGFCFLFVVEEPGWIL